MTSKEIQPLISVIIPVYNVEKYLEQCLVSVIFNSYKNLEIIVVDDGSPDNSAAIYNKYAELDKRIKIIVQENAGVSATRNKGIKAASGEYIHFMDSDDYIDLNFYEELISDALQYDSDIVACGVKMGNSVINITHSDKIICADLYTKIQKLQCAKRGYAIRYLLRRRFLIEKDIFFAVGKIHSEDLHFTLQAVKAANRVVINPNTLYHYIRRPGTISTAKNRKKLRKWAHDFRDAFLKENNLPKSLLHEPRTEYRLLLFGHIPVGKKVISGGGSKVSYNLFGIPIFKTRRKLLD